MVNKKHWIENCKSNCDKTTQYKECIDLWLNNPNSPYNQIINAKNSAREYEKLFTEHDPKTGNVLFTQQKVITPINNLVKNTLENAISPVIKNLIKSNLPSKPATYCLPAIYKSSSDTCKSAGNFEFINPLSIQ